jgi:hypothetical protein
MVEQLFRKQQAPVQFREAAQKTWKKKLQKLKKK